MILNNQDDVYRAVAITRHCESLPSWFDECRLSSKWLPTLRSNCPSSAMSLPVVAAVLIHHCYYLAWKLILILPSQPVLIRLPYFWDIQTAEWWGAGVVICWEQSNLHMIQLIPLPPIISWFVKFQIGSAFLVLAYPRCPGSVIRLLMSCLISVFEVPFRNSQPIYPCKPGFFPGFVLAGFIVFLFGVIKPTLISKLHDLLSVVLF